MVGEFPASGAEDVAAAVAAAKKAFATWRLFPAPKRAEILFRAGQLLRERKEQFAHDMTREMGKVLAETRGDVQEAIDEAFYVAGEGRRIFGKTTPSELQNKFAMSIRMPLGVVGMITPWNFPMAIPSWKLFPALVAGNTCVIKPATDTPLSVHNLVQTLVDAGVPDGVLNIVNGGGGSVGNALVEHPDVRAISFTGSSEVGSHVAQRAAATFKQVSLEMGGKNAMIVLDDANLDLALDGALWGAFGTTGQRCTATSRILLQKGIAKHFTERLVERAEKLKVGNGLDESVEVGPQVNASQIETSNNYVDIAIKEGAKLLLGGAPLTDGDYANGTFFDPTIFGGVTPGDAHRARRGLRPGAQPDRVRHLRAGNRDRQFHRLRPVVGALYQGPEQGLHGDPRFRSRHHLHQRAHHRRRSASALRRSKANRQRPPRRLRGAGVLHYVESCVRRLLATSYNARRSITRSRCRA